MNKTALSIFTMMITGLTFLTSVLIYPIKFGELKKQVEINAISDKIYKDDIRRFYEKISDIREDQKKTLIELKTLKTYIKTKEGKLLE